MVTKADLDGAPWRDVIAECPRKDVSRLTSAFVERSNAAEVAGDEATLRAYRFLAQVCSMELAEEESGEIFRPTVVLAGGRSLAVDDLSSEDLDALSGLRSEVSEPDLLARILDILWVRRNDHQAARDGVDAYLAAAQRLEDPDNWWLCAQRFKRAIHLAAALGKGGTALFDRAVATVEQTLDRYHGDDASFLSETLMGLLQQYERGDAAKYAAYAEKAALRAEAEPNNLKARQYWLAKARWHAIAGQTDEERAARRRFAETYIQDADREMKSSSPSFLRASNHLLHAIEAFRRIPGSRTRADQLRDRLADYQGRGLAELKPLETKFDHTPLVEQAQKHVSGKPFLEALFALATIGGSPNRQRLRKEAEQLAQVAPFHHLAALAKLDSEGRPVARRPPIDPSHPEEAAEGIRAEMLQHAAIERGARVQAIIDPARRVILREHHFTDADFAPIVQASPLVPPGREGIVARGLAAGLHGDFLVASHLLMPQLENSIRTLLQQAGAQVVTIDDQGLQRLRTLNQLLFLDQMNRLFGEDLTFELQGLLVEEFGANLRNRLAHGFLSHAEFYAPEPIYAWWLTLRLCCLPLLAPQPAKDEPPAPAT